MPRDCVLTYDLKYVVPLSISDNPTNKYGEALRAQVEERLAFYEVRALCVFQDFPHIA